MLEGQFIKQIIAVNNLTPVPRTRPELWGLTSTEGSILPLMNSYELFGLETSQAKMAIAIEYGQQELAFAIDEVESFQFFDSSFESAELAVEESFKPFLKTTLVKEDRVYHLIDLERLMDVTEQSLVLS